MGSGPGSEGTRRLKGLLDGPTVQGQPSGAYDGIPEPQVGQIEQQPMGWVPWSLELPGLGMEAFQELVRRITYKPGYRLTVEQPWQYTSTAAGAYLVVSYRLPDTYHPERTLAQQARFLAPPILLERWGEWIHRGEDERARKDMLRWVLKCLGVHELHERDEWLRVDGVMVFDPHRGDPTKLDFTRTS